MKFGLSILTLILLCAVAQAQQIATTAEGKKVVLNADGTWKYAGANEPNSSASIALQAGLVFNPGDVKILARVTFYLLDGSLDNILESAGLQPIGRYNTDRPIRERLMNDYVSAATLGAYPEEWRFVAAANKIIQAHIVKSVTTDFAGKAAIETVPAGNYYVMGLSNIPRSYALWNLKCELKPGENSITLDQGNAVIVF
jgi:hypothetical protein